MSDIDEWDDIHAEMTELRTAFTELRHAAQGVVDAWFGYDTDEDQLVSPMYRLRIALRESGWLE